MTQIRSYLTFNGNCREAMHFYQHCLGGELALQTVGESPMSAHIPQQMRHYILQATLTKGELLLVGSDLAQEEGLLRGNTVSLLLSCSSECETKEIYRKLAEGGRATHPPEHNFWGLLFGDLSDKYGNNWLLRYDKCQGTFTE